MNLLPQLLTRLPYQKQRALLSLDDRTLADIGYTRQQVLNGDFFNVTDVVDFPAGNLGLEKSIKQDNKIEDKVAA